MSAYSSEEIAESFKFVSRDNLDRLLLVCRQWKQLIKSFERQLSMRELRVFIFIDSTRTTVKIERTNATHLIEPWLNPKKCLEYSHPENQMISPEGPHKALFTFLDTHIRNSVFSLTLFPYVEIPLGVMCLIKDQIEGQPLRNCFIANMDYSGSERVLNPEISLIELLKASFLSADKRFSLIKTIKDRSEVGAYMSLVDHCNVVFSTANHSRKQSQKLEVSWHFNYNFPEQFIDMFKNSQKDDWPEQIVVNIISKTRPAPWIGRTEYRRPDINELSELHCQGRSILEYLWPNAKEICPDLRDRAMEIVHARNPEDVRRLTIEFTSELVVTPMYFVCRIKGPYYKYAFIFKTI